MRQAPEKPIVETPIVPSSNTILTAAQAHASESAFVVRYKTILSSMVLAAILYLIYSPVFLTDYLMNDEWWFIGLRDGVRDGARIYFLIWGRGLYGAISTLVFRYAQYNPFRIQVVRFLNFALFATVAIVLLIFLSKRSKSILLSFMVILFLFSQSPIQGCMAYSLLMVSGIPPSIWFSLMAFYVYFLTNEQRSHKFVRILAVFVLFVLAMQSTQTVAFFGMVPLTYLTLSDWSNQRRKVVEFLVIAGAVFVFSTALYSMGLRYLHSHGMHAYQLGEDALKTVHQQPLRVLLHAINPFAYWSVFQVWGYPFPFHDVAPLGISKVIAACFVMAAWIVLVVCAAVVESRGRDRSYKREVFLKWLAVITYFGYNAIFIVADSPTVYIEHRPYMALCCVGVVIFSAAYALRVLFVEYSQLRRPMPQFLGVVFVAIIAFGAQAGILRGYVTPRMEQIDFIREELAAEDPSQYQNIVVVLPDRWGCATEPCNFWAGQIVPLLQTANRKGAYRYSLATMGISPESKTIDFMSQRPDPVPPGSVIVDWKKYASLAVRKSGRPTW